MTIHEISYLLRYLFVALIAIVVWRLLALSIMELRWDMRHRILPIPGYSLMTRRNGSHPDNPENDQVRVLQLWHTTVLGSSPSCDVRLTGEAIDKRHAVIYLYDGKWFARPAGRKGTVLLNGVRIQTPTPLKNLDKIIIGDHELAFLNRNLDSDAVDMNYLRTVSTPLFLRYFPAGKLHGAWLAVNLLALLAGCVLVFLIPADLQDLRVKLGGFCLSFILLSDLYVLLLPVFLKNTDRVLMLALMLLSTLGILFQARLSLTVLDSDTALGNVALTAAVLRDFLPQGFALLIGFTLLPVIAVLMARTRLPEYGVIAGTIATPVLLILTMVLGRGADTHGASLWIQLGGMSIQLTEFAKITYLFVLAGFFKNRPSRRRQLQFAGWAAVVLFLVMMLPDIGSALVLLPTTLLVFVVMTSEYTATLAILASGTGLGALAYALFPHVQRRLAGWTSLWNEVNDGNRQIVYSLQAITRGGLFGRGISNGSPGGIPLASSDMVFAIVCEELGIITGLAIILVFIVLWLRSARLVLIGQDGFTSGLALGIGTLFFMEAAVVIAGVSGLMPLTGATLPLIAEGGSSVLAKLMLFGILIGLSARRTKVE